MVSTSTHKVQHMVSISTHKVQHKVSTSTHKVQHMVSISTQGEHINTQSTTQQCTLQTGQLRFGPYTILAWTAQSVNCHIALKAMFYLLITHATMTLALTRYVIITENVSILNL